MGLEKGLQASSTRPEGRWVGDIAEERVEALYTRYTAALQNPRLRSEPRPGTFPHELGRLLNRYKTGTKVAKHRRVKMSNRWATPTSFLRHGICAVYDIQQERFASPLNFDLAIGTYWSAFAKDAIFGATHDAYSSRMTGCGYMNPEYEQEGLEKALQWAIWSASGSDPTCFVAVFPRWNNHRYMNLLAHDAVRVVARFEEGTFAFNPPDHWTGTTRQAGKAKWQVMVIEVSNERGREEFIRGDLAQIETEGRAIGAVQARDRLQAAVHLGHRAVWADQSAGFVSARPYRENRSTGGRIGRCDAGIP